MKSWRISLFLAAASLAFASRSLAADSDAALAALAQDAEVSEAMRAVPRLKEPAAYEPKDGVLEVDISEYAGYAGIIAANNGLEPNEDSIFFKKHGFKVRLTLSEEDSWSGLNSGRMAASVTTVDVLPLYGRQLKAVVPVLIGYSRGADGIVVRTPIRSVNDLKGKTLATAQFNEADFILRFLASQVGLQVNLLENPASPRDPEKVNIVSCADSFGAGDFFLRDVLSNRARVDGCVTWDPKTSEVVEKSKGKARLLMSNRNLLIVADILLVNKGFADAHPDQVAGFVAGLLEGNQGVRANPKAYEELLAKAFGWEKEEVLAELGKVHLANLPENLAFFSGTIDSAGSYGYIYESSVQAYGSEFIPRPVPAETFLSPAPLERAKAVDIFSKERAEIKPIKMDAEDVETPLLARDIRFLFRANSAEVDLEHPQNLEDLKYMANMLNISPGSTLLLRGHVDNARVEEFRQQGGPELVQRMAIRAVQLSKDRCNSVMKALVDLHKVDPARIESLGLGWREPLGKDMEQNRRVEVQWFTLE